MAFHRDPADRRFRHFCQTGDPDALGDVFDHTAGRLQRVALWLTGNRTDAEDLLQRTFLKAIETRQQFRIGEPVLPWLMGLLGNEARRQRRERDRAAGARSVQDRVADPEAAVVARELEDTVRAVGDRLGAPYGEVLRLHLEAGLNCKEIATRLERPPGTVRTQLMRALDLLRKRLPAGFAAGVAPITTVSAAALGGVRAAVVGAAAEAAPVAAGAAPAVGLVTGKHVLLAVPVLALLGGTAAVGALWRGDAKPVVPALAAAASSELPRPGADRVELPIERVAVGEALQDPEPVNLPRLWPLGALPPGDPAVVLAADGRRSGAAASGAAPARALLHIDRAAPWGEVTKLLAELRQSGGEQVQFAAQLPNGTVGCFTLALPASDAAAPAVQLRLHRERAGVPPASIVPVLRRIVSGGREYLRRAPANKREELTRRFPQPYAVGVSAPADASFEQVLQVVAATNQAGVHSVLCTSEGARDGAAGPAPSNRAPLAIDLGPCPRIAFSPRALPLEAPVVTDFDVGCTEAAVAPAPARDGGGAGGRYGGRGGSRAGGAAAAKVGTERSLVERVAAGIAWFTNAQQADGSFRGDDGGPDLEATALVMLSLLAQGTTLHSGEHKEALNKGIGWLLDQQDDDGCFARVGPERLRHHTLATYALAEAYGLTYCLEVRGGLCDAVVWLAAQRRDDGGFGDVVPGAPSDDVSTASAVVAFASAEFFGVEAPVKSREVVTWFDDAAAPGDPTRSAPRLFSSFFAGRNPKDDEQMVAAADALVQNADPNDPWCQYWTTYSLFQMGGPWWKAWCTRVEEVAKQQHDAGDLDGSWDAAAGHSRMTTTALRVLSLQAYSRYSRLVR